MNRVALAGVFFFFAATQLCHAQTVRVRVLSRFHPTQLEVRPVNGQRIEIDGTGQTQILEAGSPARVEIEGDSLRILVHDHAARAHEMRMTSPAGDGEFLLAVPGKVSRRYEGNLLVTIRYGELALDVEMDLEAATASAVEAESGPDTPVEALKAQAVVTRSYYEAAKGRHEKDEFCDLTHCQVLRGLPAQSSAAVRATRETRGLVLLYEQKPIAAMYTRSCGGRTRTPAEDGLPANGYPYYSVVCDYCHATPQRWTRSVSAQDAELVARGEPGRLAVNRRLGWNTVPSNSFGSYREGSEVMLDGTGQGHGIGLCQLGARAMAANGQDFREILRHYFPNTTLGTSRQANP